MSTASNRLNFIYPENFNAADKQIFYFLDRPEYLPEPGIVVKRSCWWDVARTKTINLFSNPFNIILSVLGIRKKLKRFDKAAWIADNYSINYFHWINEALPKLMLLEEQNIHCDVLLTEDVA